jgi:hypothetical protein
LEIYSAETKRGQNGVGPAQDAEREHATTIQGYYSGLGVRFYREKRAFKDRKGATGCREQIDIILNERQLKALKYLKNHGRVSNPEYQEETGATKKTATRDLSDLKSKNVVEQIGERGPGVHYILRKSGDKMGTLGTLERVTSVPNAMFMTQRPGKFTVPGSSGTGGAR